MMGSGGGIIEKNIFLFFFYICLNSIIKQFDGI